MLPGDYIAMRMTGVAATTISGLSEGTLWDYSTNAPAIWLLDHFGVPSELIPPLVDTFSDQGALLSTVAEELDLPAGIPVAYRAGDQPNNALSLGVLRPGEVAATAGTSGVLYGVVDSPIIDPKMRVNSFAHVNYSQERPLYGVLLCVNGTGILNSWLKNSLFGDCSYKEMNAAALSTPIGADGALVLPYGNGAERTLENTSPGAVFSEIDFHRHSRGHILRASQEGVACALRFGLNALIERVGMISNVRAGQSNMFLSPLFREAFAALLQAPVHLYSTDGSAGAAFGAAFGYGFTNSLEETFDNIRPVTTIEPDKDVVHKYEDIFHNWLSLLGKHTGGTNG
jgi:xylulokinase